MAITNRDTIKTWFETGDYPTQQQFADAWDSYWNKLEGIPISAVTGLSTVLNALQPNLPIVGDVAGNGTVVLPAGKLILCIVLYAASASGEVMLGATAGASDWATVELPNTTDEQTQILLRRTAVATTLHFTSTLNFSYAIYTL
jgi:hypothetical protein